MRHIDAMIMASLCAAPLLLGGCQPMRPYGAPVMGGPAVTAPAAFPVVPAPVTAAMAPAHSERRILLTVDFELGRYDLPPDSRPLLTNLATAMKDQRLQGSVFEVNGHTDARGGFAYNVSLSALRAKAVGLYLRDSGVPVTALRAQGFGPLQLLDPADPFNAGNRRVEIIAIGP